MFELEKWLTDEDKAVIEASERKKTPKDTEHNQEEESNKVKDSQKSMNWGDRKSFGNMLPKQGVYFLPDTKVIDFLRVLDDYWKQCEKEGKYVEAKRAKKKSNDLKVKEAQRQAKNMKLA